MPITPTRTLLRDPVLAAVDRELTRRRKAAGVTGRYACESPAGLDFTPPALPGPEPVTAEAAPATAAPAVTYRRIQSGRDTYPTDGEPVGVDVYAVLDPAGTEIARVRRRTSMGLWACTGDDGRTNRAPTRAAAVDGWTAGYAL